MGPLYTEIPSILRTIAYLNWQQETVKSIANIIQLKLSKISQIPFYSKKLIMDWLILEAQLHYGKVEVDQGDELEIQHFGSDKKKRRLGKTLW